jgi:FkbM family methyltransferase
LQGTAAPVVFDVGANTGDSVTRFRRALSGCQIHSFEPAPGPFRELELNTRGMSDVQLINAGVGATAGTQVLMENRYSYMSSFLPPGRFAWGEIVRETPVTTTTLDDYCRARAINRIDLLKSDTQGFDFEVLKGGVELLERKRIRLVYIEVNFAEMYVGQPRFDDVYRFLVDHGFSLVAFYDFSMRGEIAGWCDALFVNHTAPA